MVIAARSWYSGYVLLLLALANVLNAVDRTLVSLLAEPIKQALAINDTSLGLLTGSAFAVSYAVAGIPIGRWADAGNRRMILALGIGVWSLMTGLSGFATGFAMLLVARIGVGLGEAAAVPVSMSLIADYFPREKRTLAVSVFQSAVFLGLAVTAFAGLIAHHYGWRSAFIAAGAVGIGVALVVLFTLVEPARGRFDLASDTAKTRPPLVESIRALLQTRVYMLILAAMAISAVSSASLGAWGAAFMIRVHGLDVAQVAAALGPASGVGGFLGALGGGFLTSHLVKRTGEKRWILLVPGIALVLAVPATLIFLFTDSATLALSAFGLHAFLWSVKMGPCYALALELVPPHLRALAISVLLVTAGLAGNGFGPPLVGAISDLLSPMPFDHSIRYAMLLAPVSLLLAAGALLFAQRERPLARRSE